MAAGEGSLEAAASSPKAAAAPGEPAALPDSDTNAPTRLPTVIVVAQKQPAELQVLPVNVTPVAAQTLQDADVRFVKEAELYAPNVFLNEFSARKLSNPYFRGIGSSPNNPGVTTYIDGVPQLNANSSSLELVDVEQLEFVRGPQGALFGRNTVGGLINITSRRPSPVWQSELQTEFGNYNYQDVRLRLSGPVAQDLGLSLPGQLPRGNSRQSLVCRGLGTQRLRHALCADCFRVPEPAIGVRRGKRRPGDLRCAGRDRALR